MARKNACGFKEGCGAIHALLKTEGRDDAESTPLANGVGKALEAGNQARNTSPYL
jgi:hypothetical protein